MINRLMVFLIVIIIFSFSIFFPSCQAIKTIEIESMHFEKNPITQGENDSLVFNITNYLANTAIIKYLGVQFDWQTGNDFYEDKNVISNPINLLPSNTVIDKIDFTVPGNASVGVHNYLFTCRFDFQGGGGGIINVTGKDFQVKQGAQETGKIAFTSIKFENNNVVQGGDIVILIEIKNGANVISHIYFLGVHYEWLNSDEFIQCSEVTKAGFIDITSGNTTTFKIGTGVPPNARTGINEYKISCKYRLEGDGEGIMNETRSDLKVQQGASGSGNQNSAVLMVGLGIILGIILFVLIIVLSILCIIYRRKVRKLENKIMTQKTPVSHTLNQPPPPQLQVIAPIPVSTPEPQLQQSDQKTTSIGAIEKINNCPFCGKKLSLKKSPKFCPYCNEEIG